MRYRLPQAQYRQVLQAQLRQPLPAPAAVGSTADLRQLARTAGTPLPEKPRGRPRKLAGATS